MFTHIVPVCDGDIHVDDGPAFVRCEDIPVLVRGTVRYLRVVLALKGIKNPCSTDKDVYIHTQNTVRGPGTETWRRLQPAAMGSEQGVVNEG